MKNCKGFTLVELIVTLAISMVLLVSVASVLLSSTNVANRTEAKADSELIAESLLDEIRSVSNTAHLIEVVYDADSVSDVVLIDAKMLKVNGDGYPVFMSSTEGEQPFTTENKIFADKFYKDKTIKLTAEDAGENRVDLTIQVYLDEKMMYEITTRLQPASLLHKGEAGGTVDPDIGNTIDSYAHPWEAVRFYRKGSIIKYDGTNPPTYYIVTVSFLTVTSYPLTDVCYQKINMDTIYQADDLTDGKLSSVNPGDVFADSSNIYVYVGNTDTNVTVPSGSIIPKNWLKAKSKS